MIGALLLRNWQAVAGILAVAAIVLLWQADRSAQFKAGQEAERTAARERAMELIEKRMQDDAEISAFDAADLCRELGGDWLREQQTCN